MPAGTVRDYEELKIKELRAYAATTLGSRFDVLDARIRAWVASVR